MALNLGRCELVQTATVSHQGTLALFPLGKKKKQKFVIGDDSGAVSCFEMKRGDAVASFVCQTHSEPIQNISLNLNPSKRDRVFASQGQSIFAVSKKGKEVFRLVAPSTEPIKNMIVEDLKIFTGGEFIFQLYNNSKDAGYLMCQDHINSIVTIPGPPGSETSDCLLACSDKKLRVVRSHLNNTTSLISEHDVTSTITALVPYNLSSSSLGDDNNDNRNSLSSTTSTNSNSNNENQILYGTNQGEIGIMTIHEDYIEKHLEVSSSIVGGRGGGVSMLYAHDITRDGTPEMIVARDDGLVQIIQQKCSPSSSSLSSYAISSSPSSSLSTSMIPSSSSSSRTNVLFETEMNETIRGLNCGTVSSNGFDEMICLTFSGKVVSFTTELMERQDEGDTKGRSVKENRDEATLRGLKEDLTQLQAQLKEEQRKLSLVKSVASTSDSSSSSSSSSPIMTPGGSINLNTPNAPQRFEVQSRVELDIKEGAYGISIEVPLPLALITLTSTVRLDLLDTTHSSSFTQTESEATDANSSNSNWNWHAANNGIIGMSPPTETKPVLATFRFSESTNRAHIRYRTNEGESGEVVLGVVAKTSPKVCQIIRLHVKPLSLHHRVHILPSVEKNNEIENEKRLKRQIEKEEREKMEAEAEAFAEEKLLQNGKLSSKDDDDDDEDKNSDEFEIEKMNSKLRKTRLDDKDAKDNDNENDNVGLFTMNTLKVSGNFSLRMAHDWINACLPEVPPRVGQSSSSYGGSEASEELFYTNSFTQSELSINYSAGYLLIQSDSASSIAIMRDVIATKARDLRVDVELDDIKMNNQACICILEKLDPLLRSHNIILETF